MLLNQISQYVGLWVPAVFAIGTLIFMGLSFISSSARWYRKNTFQYPAADASEFRWSSRSQDGLKLGSAQSVSTLPTTEAVVGFSAQRAANLSRVPTEHVVELPAIPRPNWGKPSIAFALWGDRSQDVDGARENVKLARKLFPEWRIVVYLGVDVPADVVQFLHKSENVVLRNMTNSQIINRMSWRFLIASDPTTSRYIIRDIDSRLLMRDKLAIDDWIASGRLFSNMRDHPAHADYVIGGGLWGGISGAIPDMEKILFQGDKFKDNNYFTDMAFLSESVWPVMSKSVMQHDAYACRRHGGGFPFPFARHGGEHVGGRWIQGQMEKVDMEIVLRNPASPECHSPNRTALTRGDINWALVVGLYNVDVERRLHLLRHARDSFPEWKIVALIGQDEDVAITSDLTTSEAIVLPITPLMMMKDLETQSKFRMLKVNRSVALIPRENLGEHWLTVDHKQIVHDWMLSGKLDFNLSTDALTFQGFVSSHG